MTLNDRRQLQTYRQCTLYMTIADDTNRNNLLDQEEYVLFLNWLLNGAFDGFTF